MLCQVSHVYRTADYVIVSNIIAYMCVDLFHILLQQLGREKGCRLSYQIVAKENDSFFLTSIIISSILKNTMYDSLL